MSPLLNPELLAELLAHLATAPDRLCPSCGQHRIDPKSEEGWCPACSGARARVLARKRRWWNENRGKDAPVRPTE